MTHRLHKYGRTGHPSEGTRAQVDDGVSRLGTANIRSDETAETHRDGSP